MGATEGHGLKIKTPRCGPSVLQAEEEVLFGSAGEVYDPRLPVPIFNNSVVGLVFDDESAVSHGESSIGG